MNDNRNDISTDSILSDDDYQKITNDVNHTDVESNVKLGI